MTSKESIHKHNSSSAFTEWSDDDINTATSELKNKYDRRRRKSRVKRTLGIVVSGLVVAGGAVGLADRLGTFVEQHPTDPIAKVYDTTSKIVNNSVEGAINANTGKILLSGHESVHIGSGDSLDLLIEKNVKGWDELSTQQMNTLRTDISKDNPGVFDEDYQIGGSGGTVNLPTSVKQY